MNDILLWVMSITSLLVIYWLVSGQWKYNRMMKQQQKLEKPKKIKAVIFDLDGTIVDSIDAWYKIFNKTLKHYKQKEISKKEFIKVIWGKSLKKASELYFKGASVEEIGKIYFKFADEFRKETKLSPNVMETLEKLKEKNIKMAIVTNTFNKQTIINLKYHKIDKFFETVIGGDDVKYGKPAPDSLLKACSNMKILPNEAILVGDTFNDYGAAKNAQMFFIGFHMNGNLKIDDLKDVLQLI